MDVEYFVDNNAKLEGKTIHEKRVHLSKQLLLEKNATVCIMTDKYRDEIQEQLDEMRLDSSVKVVDYVSLQDEFIRLHEEFFIGVAKEKLSFFRKLMDWEKSDV